MRVLSRFDETHCHLARLTPLPRFDRQTATYGALTKTFNNNNNNNNNNNLNLRPRAVHVRHAFSLVFYMFKIDSGEAVSEQQSLLAAAAAVTEQNNNRNLQVGKHFVTF